MLTAETCEAIARRLIHEHDEGIARTPMPEAATASVEDAYRVQDSLVRLMVERGAGDIKGYKIALTSDAMQQMVGVDSPVAGVLLESRLLASPSVQSLASFQKVGLEFEIAVTLSQSLPAASAPHTVESVAAAVDSVAPAFELVEDRNADYSAIDAFGLIADNCWNGGNVIGKPRALANAPDLSSASAVLSINGEEVETATTGAVMGHPFEVVAWMANLLNNRDRQLEAGMTVMTGSSMQTRFPQAGDRYTYAVEGLGSVSLRMEP